MFASKEKEWNEFESLQSKLLLAGSLVSRSDSQSTYHLLVIARQMRADGHAVAFDETFNHLGEFVESHLIHYLTCMRCMRKDN